MKMNMGVWVVLGAAAIVLTAATIYVASKAADNEFANEDTKASEDCKEGKTAAPVSPEIGPADIAGKTPEEIEQIAKEKGLVSNGPDPKAGKGAWTDPVTGKQRILSHPTGKPGPHAHVNNPAGERLGIDGKVVPAESPEAHLPLKVK